MQGFWFYDRRDEVPQNSADPRIINVQCKGPPKATEVELEGHQRFLYICFSDHDFTCGMTALKFAQIKKAITLESLDTESQRCCNKRD